MIMTTEKLASMLADHEALEGVSEWLKTQELTINIGPVQGDHDEHVESSAGWLLRLCQTALAERALEPEEKQADIFYAVLNPGGTEGVLFKDKADADFTAIGDCESWSTPTIGEAFRESYAEDGAMSVRQVVLQSPASQLALPAGPVPKGAVISRRLLLKAIQAINYHLEPESPEEHEQTMKELGALLDRSPAVAQPVADEREAFERAAGKQGEHDARFVKNFGSEVYFRPHIAAMWEGWKLARAALCQPAEEGGKS